MTHFMSRTSQSIVDLAILSVALWAAFLLRFEGHLPFLMLKRLMFVWPWVVGLQFGIMVVLGIHRFSWRYIGLREVTRIWFAIGLAASVLIMTRLISGQLGSLVSGYFSYVLIPFSVILMNAMIAFVGITGIRALRRIVSEKTSIRRQTGRDTPAEPTLLIGAGAAGLLVAKELLARPELGMRPVGFLDDDSAKVGTVVHGVPVLASFDDIAKVLESREVTQALITIASARGKDIRRIGRQCRELGLRTKIIPPVRDIVGGEVNMSAIRELAIEDLLRRDPIKLDEEHISTFIEGQAVAVTGAGGSIGSELCAQICQFSPARLVMIERSENALFEAHRALLIAFPEIDLVPCIADICDSTRVRTIFSEHSPMTVFHAAAHKHVPMMEDNPGEAVKNNVLGTKCLADVSCEMEVEAFVMVSTDKAVNPTSVMGATKRIAEMYVQALARQSDTRFVTVRFGNVLGSAGSVIPIFKKQIAEGGPVTVTHPDMTRYFMTIPEACQLILQASTMGKGGEIFILDMGEPVRIVNLAEDLITLSGFEVGTDIEIVFSGIRPGEKLYEELSSDSENAQRTLHPKIMIGRNNENGRFKIEQEICGLESIIDSPSDEVRRAILHFVPEYHSPALPVVCQPPESTQATSKSSASTSAQALG